MKNNLLIIVIIAAVGIFIYQNNTKVKDLEARVQSLSAKDFPQEHKWNPIPEIIAPKIELSKNYIKKIEPPVEALTAPGAKCFIYNDGEVVEALNSKTLKQYQLIGIYLHCSIIAEIGYKGNKFYLVETHEPNYANGKWVLEEKNIIKASLVSYDE